MRLTLALAATACLTLAACGGGDSAGGNNAAAGGEAANASGSASGADSGSTTAAAAGGSEGLKLSPGLYETTIELSISGLPPEMAKAMQGVKETKKSCVTPEEAAKGSGDLFGDKEDGCQTKDVVFSGGRIQGTMTCPNKGGEGTATVTLAGSYTSTSLDVRSSMVTQAQGKEMKVESRIVGRRVGECTGSEDE